MRRRCGRKVFFMTDKELKKLNKRELLELLAAMREEIDALRVENEALRRTIAGGEGDLLSATATREKALRRAFLRGYARQARNGGRERVSGMSRMNGKRELAKDLPTAEQLKAELARRKSRAGFMRMLYSTAASLIVVAALAVIISMLFLPVLRVTGTSMTPTLANDELVVCKRRGDFKQGDIVAFYYNNKILLKRVIAVSGDTVDIKDDGTVYVNGKKLDEPYVKDKAFGECNISLPYQVPDQRIFVMGDHRSTSIDSRSSAIGCVSEEAVVGKVVMRIMPLKKLMFL